MNSPEKSKLEAAIKDELHKLEISNCYKLVPRPTGKRVYNCKWVLKRTRGKGGNIDQYKARLVFCGNQEKKFQHEVFAPVADFSVVRLMLSIAVQSGMLVRQLDFESAFLQAWIKRKVYMEIPYYMTKPSSQDMVCELEKSLYGLKDAPKLWYDHSNTELMEI